MLITLSLAGCPPPAALLGWAPMALTSISSPRTTRSRPSARWRITCSRSSSAMCSWSLATKRSQPTGTAPKMEFLPEVPKKLPWFRNSLDRYEWRVTLIRTLANHVINFSYISIILNTMKFQCILLALSTLSSCCCQTTARSAEKSCPDKHSGRKLDY